MLQTVEAVVVVFLLRVCFWAVFPVLSFHMLCNEFHIGNTYIPEKNFALMGMAGLMSGVMHAPLTGVFLIAELTGGYALFLASDDCFCMCHI